MQARTRSEEWHAWFGASLLVTDLQGSCGTAPLSGYYFRETRHLNRVRLLVDGEPAWLCESSQLSPVQLRFLYVYPEVTAYGGGSRQFGDRRGRPSPRQRVTRDTSCTNC